LSIAGLCKHVAHRCTQLVANKMRRR